MSYYKFKNPSFEEVFNIKCCKKPLLEFFISSDYSIGARCCSCGATSKGGSFNECLSNFGNGIFVVDEVGLKYYEKSDN